MTTYPTENTMNENFRVENKRNVHMNGHRTMFKLYRKQGDAFVHVGTYTSKGWEATDDKCVAAALKTQAQENDD